MGDGEEEMKTRLITPTTGIDDVSGHVLWSDLGWDGDLRDDMLNLEGVSRRAVGDSEEDVHV